MEGWPRTPNLTGGHGVVVRKVGVRLGLWEAKSGGVRGEAGPGQNRGLTSTALVRYP